jgi:hypothetical protein
VKKLDNSAFLIVRIRSVRFFSASFQIDLPIPVPVPEIKIII